MEMRYQLLFELHTACWMPTEYKWRDMCANSHFKRSKCSHDFRIL